MNTSTVNALNEEIIPSPIRSWLPEIAVFAVAVIGRLPAMGAWWSLDDWGQLARAAGLENSTTGAEWQVRWLSQHLYWDLTWPVFGLSADSHTIIRLILHGLAAVLVVRIARRGGLGTASRLVAGLVFAASPLAFTPLYWASGIQELLAAVFALAAVDRWLAGNTGGRRQLAWAAALATLSILSKESGLGLPILFLVFAWQRIGVRLEDKLFAWAMIMLLLPVAVGESVLVLNHFASGAGEPYATGGLSVILMNFGAFGWWLMSPGPVLASGISTLMAVAGGLLFMMWAAWGVFMWRRRSPLALMALVAAVLVLAPALPLRYQVVPYLAYLAVAPVGLLVGAIIQQFKTMREARAGHMVVVGFVSLVAILTSFWSMETRLNNRNELGLVADPVARATALSWQGCRTIKQLQSHPGLNGADQTGFTHLVLMQPVVNNATMDRALDVGERWTQPSDLHEALGGAIGPRMVLPPEINMHWANGLTTASSKAVVLCETATGFRMWGQVENALLYAALTDVGLGHYDRARRHLMRAGELSGDQIIFIYDAGQMVIPLRLVLQNKEAFTDWTLGLMDLGAPRQEVAGLQEMFFNLLVNATGRTMKELTAGSHLMNSPTEPAPHN